METLGEYLESREEPMERDWKVRELYRMGILEALHNHTFPHRLRSDGWWAVERDLHDSVVGRLRMLEAAQTLFKELELPESMETFRKVLQGLISAGEVEMGSIEARSRQMAFIFYNLTPAVEEEFEEYRLMLTEQRTLLDFGSEQEFSIL